MSAFALSVRLKVKAEHLDHFTALLLDNAKAARELERGCRGFDVLVDPKDRAQLMLYEVYESEAAFEAHQQTPHFKKYFAERVPLLESRERFFWRRAAP